MKPTKAELHARQQIDGAGVDHFTRQTMGMSAQRLTGHLAVADRLLMGDKTVLKSPRVRGWLLRQAQESGHTAEQVDEVIRRVMTAHSPEEAVKVYATALSGDPAAAQRGLSLAQHYQRESISDRVNTRLEAQDRQQLRSGSTFQLPDNDRLAQARQEAGAVRQALEAAAVSSGLAAPRPQSLQDHQVRAQIYANRAADDIEQTERRRAAGEKIDIRTDIENAWRADRALQAKTDAGLGTDRAMSDVMERVDAANAVVDGAMELVERG